MSVESLMTKTVDITYQVLIGVDIYGQPLYDYTTTPAQCYYRFMSSTLTDVAGRIETAEVEVFLRAGTQITDIEHITLDGEQYVLSGVADPALNARTGEISHLVLRLRRGDS